MPASPRPIVYRYRHVLLASWLFLFAWALVWLFLPSPWFPVSVENWIRVLFYHYEKTYASRYDHAFFAGITRVVGFPELFWGSNYNTPIATSVLTVFLGTLGLFVFSCKPRSGDRPNLIQIDLRLSALIPVSVICGLLLMGGMLVVFGWAIVWFDWTLIGITSESIHNFLLSVNLQPNWWGTAPNRCWLVPVVWLGCSGMIGFTLFLTRKAQSGFIRYEQITRFISIAAMIVLLISAMICYRTSFFELGRRGGYYASYSAMVFSLFVLIWAFGCRVILLFRFPQYELQRTGHYCLACGYDLRGTVAAGRKECPECGRAMTREQLARVVW